MPVTSPSTVPPNNVPVRLAQGIQQGTAPTMGQISKIGDDLKTVPAPNAGKTDLAPGTPGGQVPKALLTPPSPNGDAPPPPTGPVTPDAEQFVRDHLGHDSGQDMRLDYAAKVRHPQGEWFSDGAYQPSPAAEGDDPFTAGARARQMAASGTETGLPPALWRTAGGDLAQAVGVHDSEGQLIGHGIRTYRHTPDGGVQVARSPLSTRPGTPDVIANAVNAHEGGWLRGKGVNDAPSAVHTHFVNAAGYKWDNGAYPNVLKDGLKVRSQRSNAEGDLPPKNITHLHDEALGRPESLYFSHGKAHLDGLERGEENYEGEDTGHDHRPDSPLSQEAIKEEKQRVYAGFTNEDHARAIASNMTHADKLGQEAVGGNDTRTMPYVSPARKAALNKRWKEQTLPLKEFDRHFPRGVPQGHFGYEDDGDDDYDYDDEDDDEGGGGQSYHPFPTPSHEDDAEHLKRWRTEIMLPGGHIPPERLYSPHSLMRKMGLLDERGYPVDEEDHGVSHRQYAEALKNDMRRHFGNDELFKSLAGGGVTQVHVVHPKTMAEHAPAATSHATPAVAPPATPAVAPPAGANGQVAPPRPFGVIPDAHLKARAIVNSLPPTSTRPEDELAATTAIPHPATVFGDDPAAMRAHVRGLRPTDAHDLGEDAAQLMGVHLNGLSGVSYPHFEKDPDKRRTLQRQAERQDADLRNRAEGWSAVDRAAQHYGHDPVDNLTRELHARDRRESHTLGGDLDLHGEPEVGNWNTRQAAAGTRTAEEIERNINRLDLPTGAEELLWDRHHASENLRGQIARHRGGSNPGRDVRQFIARNLEQFRASGTPIADPHGGYYNPAHVAKDAPWRYRAHGSFQHQADHARITAMIDGLRNYPWGFGDDTPLTPEQRRAHYDELLRTPPESIVSPMLHAAPPTAMNIETLAHRGQRARSLANHFDLLAQQETKGGDKGAAKWAATLRGRYDRLNHALGAHEDDLRDQKNEKIGDREDEDDDNPDSHGRQDGERITNVFPHFESEDDFLDAHTAHMRSDVIDPETGNPLWRVGHPDTHSVQGGTHEFHIFDHNDQIMNIRPVSRSYRLHSDGTREVHNNLLELRPEFQGGGTANELYKKQEEFYKQHGIDHVTINADIDVGKYAWAKNGFGWASPHVGRERTRQYLGHLRDEAKRPGNEHLGLDKHADQLETMIQGHMRTADYLHPWEIANDDAHADYRPVARTYTQTHAVPSGKHFMLSGESWNARKDLSDANEGYQIGRRYQDEKIARKKADVINPNPAQTMEDRYRKKTKKIENALVHQAKAERARPVAPSAKQIRARNPLDESQLHHAATDYADPIAKALGVLPGHGPHSHEGRDENNSDAWLHDEIFDDEWEEKQRAKYRHEHPDHPTPRGGKFMRAKPRHWSDHVALTPLSAEELAEHIRRHGDLNKSVTAAPPGMAATLPKPPVIPTPQAPIPVPKKTAAVNPSYEPRAYSAQPLRERDQAQLLNGQPLYHGTGMPHLEPTTLDSRKTRASGLYGPGVYLTANPEIAQQYAHNADGKAGNEFPTVYHAKTNFRRVLNLDDPAPEHVRKIFERVARPHLADDYADPDEAEKFTTHLAHPNTPTTALYRQLCRTIDDFDGYDQNDEKHPFRQINRALSRHGYDGLTHLGGGINGDTRHTVAIVLDPERAARDRPVPPVKKLDPQFQGGEASKFPNLAYNARRHQNYLDELHAVARDFRPPPIDAPHDPNAAYSLDDALNRVGYKHDPNGTAPMTTDERGRDIQIMLRRRGRLHRWAREVSEQGNDYLLPYDEAQVPHEHSMLAAHNVVSRDDPDREQGKNYEAYRRSRWTPYGHAEDTNELDEAAHPWLANRILETAKRDKWFDPPDVTAQKSFAKSITSPVAPKPVAPTAATPVPWKMPVDQWKAAYNQLATAKNAIPIGPNGVPKEHLATWQAYNIHSSNPPAAIHQHRSTPLVPDHPRVRAAVASLPAGDTRFVKELRVAQPDEVRDRAVALGRFGSRVSDPGAQAIHSTDNSILIDPRTLQKPDLTTEGVSGLHHTVVHEVGHSIHQHLPQQLEEEWEAIHPPMGVMKYADRLYGANPQGEPPPTSNGHENHLEDFADSYRVYRMGGKDASSGKDAPLSPSRRNFFDKVHVWLNPPAEQGGTLAHKSLAKPIAPFRIVQKSLAPTTDEHTGVMIGLWLDEKTATHLALPDGLPPGEMHITLAFLGDESDLTAAQLAAVQRVAHRWARERSPLQGTARSLGKFAPTKQSGGETVWFVEPQVEGLAAARDSLCKMLRAAKVPYRKDHAFHPHITLRYGGDKPAAPPAVDLHFAGVTVAIGGKRTAYPFSRDSLTKSQTDDMQWATYRKTAPTHWRVAARDQTIETREGPVKCVKGDVICTGVENERWPVSRASFVAKHGPITARFGVYHPTGTVRAKREPHAFTVGKLHGKAGDWRIKDGDDEWIVAASIFAKTYAKAEEMKKSINPPGKNRNKMPPAKPHHHYRAQQGDGYDHRRAVPAGTPHRHDERPEAAQMPWKLGDDGAVHFHRRGHKDHPRHAHTLLPVTLGDQSRHDLLTARAAADHARDGGRDGFGATLPGPGDLPLHGDHEHSQHALSHYRAARDARDHTARHAHRDGDQAAPADSWAHFVGALGEHRQRLTGAHPEEDLLAADLHRMVHLKETLSGMGLDRLVAGASMRTLPMPGLTWHLRADRSVLVGADELDAVDRQMVATATAIAHLFPASVALDARKTGRVRGYRRAWLQLARDIEATVERRHVAEDPSRKPHDAVWGELADPGTGTPYYKLSQHDLAQNFARLVPTAAHRDAERSLSLTFGQLVEEKQGRIGAKAPAPFAHLGVMAYCDRIAPYHPCTVDELLVILGDGALNGWNQYDPSGLSHSPLVGDDPAAGMRDAVWLAAGAPHGDPDVAIVFHPRVWQMPGAVAAPQDRLPMDDHGESLKDLLYRPDRISRALVDVARGILPRVLAGRWDDLADLSWCHHAGSRLALPRAVPLADARQIVLSPRLADHVVARIRDAAHGRCEVVVGEPKRLLSPLAP